MVTPTAECNICFEPTLTVNNCTTECGHHFCFKCIATAMQHSNTCPCCRRELYQQTPINNDEHDIVSRITNNVQVGCVDDIAAKLEEEGVTMIDVLSFYNDRYNSRGSKYQMHNDIWLSTIDWVEDVIYRTIQEVDEQSNDQIREQYDSWLMRREDKRSAQI